MKHDIKRGRLEALLRFTENVGLNAVTRMRIVDPLKQHYTWYTYDDQGRQGTMRSIVVDGGFGVGAQPVLPAELASIPNDPATSVTLAPDEQFIYNERNELVSTILTGPVKRVNRTYNQRGWVTSITAKDELPFSQKLPEFQQHLEYDAAGLIKGQCWLRSGATAGETYIYDELQRLKSYIGSNGTNAYDYDLVGNRQSDLTGGTARVYAHGGAALQPNALVSVTGATHNAQFTYDAHGALTLRTMKEFTPQTATSKIEEFCYDASGLIERYQVRRAAGQGGQSVECAPDASMSPRSDWRYRFGPMKEREQKRLYLSDQGPNASLPWVYYLISPSKQQLAVYNGVEGKPCGGALGNVYMWPVEYNAYGVGGGRVITRPDNTKRFVVTDHLGSVRLTYDAQGAVLETADYEPFGALAAKTGEEARTGYIGRETDNESNLGFNGVRLYDQHYGRFLSTDAMWESSRDVHSFHYAHNSPVSRLDGNGLFDIDEHVSMDMEAFRAANPDASFFSTLWAGISSWATHVNADVFNIGNSAQHLDNMNNEMAQEWLDAGGYERSDNHQMQDFYCHSNYVEIMTQRGYTADNMPLLDELDKNGEDYKNVRALLHTTTYPSNGSTTDHDPTENKDLAKLAESPTKPGTPTLFYSKHKNSNQYETAKGLGTKATVKRALEEKQRSEPDS
ncbi:MAG: hypothetical protein JSS89_09475 [Bacteroidetes bacterium]|nr:hypothetical protein [Bacteroidota bacterium]